MLREGSGVEGGGQAGSETGGAWGSHGGRPGAPLLDRQGAEGGAPEGREKRQIAPRQRRRGGAAGAAVRLPKRERAGASGVKEGMRWVQRPAIIWGYRGSPVVGRPRRPGERLRRPRPRQVLRVCRKGARRGREPGGGRSNKGLAMPNSSGGCDPWSRPSPSPGPLSSPLCHRRPWTQASGLASGLGPGRAISKAPGAPSPPALTRLALGPLASGHHSASGPPPLRVPSRVPWEQRQGRVRSLRLFRGGRRRGWGGGVTGARDAAMAKGSLQVGRGPGRGQGQVQG